MFWLSFLEIMRVLKPWGICYLNVPSNGPVHEYPVDCWRFYPDSGIALQTWARHSGYSAVLLESYIDTTDREWNDFTAVILKDSAWSHQFSRRISQGSGPWSHVRTGL